MDQSLAGVDESLSSEFGDMNRRTVARVITDCADELPHDDLSDHPVWKMRSAAT